MVAESDGRVLRIRRGWHGESAFFFFKARECTQKNTNEPFDVNATSTRHLWGRRVMRMHAVVAESQWLPKKTRFPMFGLRGNDFLVVCGGSVFFFYLCSWSRFRESAHLCDSARVSVESARTPCKTENEQRERKQEKKGREVAWNGTFGVVCSPTLRCVVGREAGCFWGEIVSERARWR